MYWTSPSADQTTTKTRTSTTHHQNSHVDHPPNMLNALVTTSTTPRTARAYLDELQAMANPDVTDLLYTGAKVSLHDHDIVTSRILLAQCPRGYRNASTYAKKLDVYEQLKTAGVRRSRDLVHALQEILQEAEAATVRQYADDLSRHGYNVASLDALTQRNVETAMAVCRMAPGHRVLLERHATSNTHPCVLASRALSEHASLLEHCLRSVCRRGKADEETATD